MIEVTKINGKKVFLNNDLIETIEETPDTVVTLTTGKKFIVKESGNELVIRVKKFRKMIYNADYEVTDK